MNLKSFASSVGVVAISMITANAPSQAASVIPAVFDFTVGSNNYVSDGNSRVYTATSSQLGTYKVRVTGWSLEKVGNTTYVRDSKLMVYDGGLGVISGDDNGGNSNQHTIDNEGRKDFILLQFDRNVQLTTATFNTYSVLGGTRDSDATLQYGSTSVAWNTGLNINDKNVSVLNALFDGSYSSLGPSNSNSTRNVNPDLFTGNLWLIGADFTNSDRKIDGFKLASLAVVPEPATWAMMIGGFGLVGGALRRRSAAAQRVLA